MLRVEKLNKSFGPKSVLVDVSFSIEKGQRAALVGQNGIGKSTLLKIIAGIEESDSGSIDIRKNVRIGYLPQDTSAAQRQTIAEYIRVEMGIDAIEQQMSSFGPESSEYQEAYEAYLRMEGYSFEHRLEVMMSGFGFEDVEQTRFLSHLSSGQKSKIALIGILMKGADILLLDEPTNNLDLPALIWLEDFLLKTDAACIIVSHDRRFIDRTATKVFELDEDSHALTISNGSYSDYLAMREKRRARQQQQYEEQKEEVRRLKQQATDLRQRAEQGSHFQGTDNDKFRRGFLRDKAGSSGRKAKTIEKRIEQMDVVAKPIEREPLRIPLVAQQGYGDRDIVLSDLVVGYPGAFSVGPLSLRIRFGERIGFIGANGSGKSTILKTITGDRQPLSGALNVGAGLRLGNLMQEHDSLPRDVGILNFIREKLDVGEDKAYSILSHSGLDTSQAKSNIGVLSPGARARLLIGMFAALSTNALILDEPTNHLDLEAMEALEDALASYEGTVIVVSHDRYFVEKASLGEILLVEHGTVSQLKSYRNYLAAAEEKANRLLRIL